MKILGLDLSTSTCGWAISDSGIIVDAGFFRIEKVETYKEKSKMIIEGLDGKEFDKINVEETLSGFSSGFTSQQTLIKLVKNKSVICYILEETWKKPIISLNVNTVRKKVFGKSRIKGIKPKEYVKSQVPLYVPNIKEFEKLNRNGDWDMHNGDMYDAVTLALFG